MDIIGLVFYKLPVVIVPVALFLFILNGVRSKIWSIRWVVVGLLIPVLWVFGSILFSSKLFVAGQTELSHLIPLQDGWKTGMLSLTDTPFWYDRFSNGHPLHASPVSLFFYPFNWIFLLTNTYTGFSWFIALHFWLGAVFFALFIREFGYSRTAAYVAGYAYVMNEWFLMKTISPTPMYLLAAIWFPLVLLYLLHYLTNTNRPYAICGLSVAYAFLFMANFNVFMFG